MRLSLATRTVALSCLSAVTLAPAHADDFSWVVYRLRKEARWHDGVPVTPDDVIFSIENLKKQAPFYASYYRHVVKAEKSGERDIKFSFDGPGNRELPTIVGELIVLPKHWWEGSNSDGKKRDISATTLEKPLGSGPYRIKEFVAGRSVVLERVKDYWGATLPVQVGQNNFDELRFEFFRDNLVALEAFKADQVDWIFENSAKQWATAYDFPAVRDGRVYLAPGAPFGFIDRPPSVNRLIGLHWLMRALYPGAVETPLAEDVRRFYALFYHVELDDAAIARLLGE